MIINIGKASHMHVNKKKNYFMFYVLKKLSWKSPTTSFINSKHKIIPRGKMKYYFLK